MEGRTHPLPIERERFFDGEGMGTNFKTMMHLESKATGLLAFTIGIP